MDFSESPLYERMIFTVGAQRSGTFWLQRILTTHPEIAAVPSETALFSDGIEPLFARFQHAAIESPQVGALYVERQRLLSATRSFCDAVLEPHLDPGARFLSERTAVHVRHLELIAQIYPDARFIHIIRDGRDVARSITGQHYGPDDIEGAAEEWRSCIASARAAGLPSERYREVRYEDLFDAPEREISSLFEWVGLPLDDRRLEQALTEGMRRKNVDRSDRSGAGKEKWRSALSARDLAAFEDVAGDLRRELGYPEAKAGPGSRAQRSGGRQRLRRLDPRRRRPAPPEPPGRRLIVADRAIGLLRSGQIDDLVAMTTADFSFRLVTTEDETVRRGDEARRLLRKVASGDPALAGEQTLGHVHAGGSTIGYVLRFSINGGQGADRVAFITVQGQRTTEMTYYVIPGIVGLEQE